MVEYGNTKRCLLAGSGTSQKTKTLLRSWLKAGKLAAFVPVDISADFLEQAAEQLRKVKTEFTFQEFPTLTVLPQVADISKDFELKLPASLEKKGRIVLYLGSSIGNFEHEETTPFLKKAGKGS